MFAEYPYIHDMRIYIKAPYWRNSDFFAHVAEHYVVHQLLDHKERFFRLQGMIEAHTCKSGFYISLPDGIVAPKECISWCAVEQINKSMLKLEINALMQELRGEGKNT